PDAGYGAAGADAGDENVELAAGVVPDFLRRRAAMNVRVRRIFELLRHHRILGVLQDLVGFGEGAAYAFRGRRQHQLGAQYRQHLAPFDRHGLRHDENAAIAALSRHESEGDAGVAARRFDNDAAGLEFAGLLQRVDHGDADAVLYRGD